MIAISHQYHALTTLLNISLSICAKSPYDDDKYVEELLYLGGSSAGARPKVLMHLDDEHWLIKFPSNLDPKDIGAIEYLTPQQK